MKTVEEINKALVKLLDELDNREDICNTDYESGIQFVADKLFDIINEIEIN